MTTHRKTRSPWLALLFTLCATLVASGSIDASAASSSSPIGTWKTYDDETGAAKAIVEIYERDGKLRGRITTLLSKKSEVPTCTKCKGHRKDKPIEGMVILWGLEKDDTKTWDGGRILDPGKGKVYDCSIELAGEGSALNVRGYLGWSALGRDQTWKRVR